MNNYNWAAIKECFEQTAKSLRTIASEFGIKSPSAITKKAKKNGWKRETGSGKQKEETGNSVSIKKNTLKNNVGDDPEMGRPTKFTEEIAKEICDRLSVGESLISVCRDDHMPERVSVYNWLSASVLDDANEDLKNFLYQYKRSRELQADSFFDEAIDIADCSEHDTITKTDRQGNEYEAANTEAIQRSKLRVETRFKIAAISKPKKYSEKRLLELTGKDGGPVETNHTIMTQDQIEKEMKDRGLPIPE